MRDQNRVLEPPIHTVSFRSSASEPTSLPRTGEPCGAVASTVPPNGSGADSSHAEPTPEFETIYDQYFDLVWHLLRRLGVTDAACDDALQDVFLIVHRRLSEFEGRSTLRTWIIGITLRVGSEHVRRWRRTAPVSATNWDLRDEKAPDPLEQTARGEAVRLLYALLDELDSDKRAVFVLAEIEQMSIRDIASVMGGKPNTISSRLKAARRQFQAALQRHRARDGWRSN